MNQNLENIKNIVAGGGNIVILSGAEVMRETGLNGVRAEHLAYDIEQQYGYSNDEIVSNLFYSRRVELFYDYYKNVILNKENVQPSAVHYGIAKLQRCGKLDAVVTRMVYCLHQKAGCDKVIELHGSVEGNRCPRCGKIFNSDYIKHAKGVPHCDVCNVPLRPGFSLIGEMIDNGKMTQASNAVERARILMILGAAANSTLCRYILKYYNGDKLILLNTHETPGDEIVNYREYGNLSDMFSYITSF